MVKNNNRHNSYSIPETDIRNETEWVTDSANKENQHNLRLIHFCEILNFLQEMDA